MKGLNVVSVAGEHMPTSAMSMFKEQARKQARLLSRELERKSLDNEDVILVCGHETILIADEAGNCWENHIGGVERVIY